MKKALLFIILAAGIASCQKAKDRRYKGVIYSVLDSLPVKNTSFELSMEFSRANGGAKKEFHQFTTNADGSFEKSVFSKASSEMYIRWPQGKTVASLNNSSSDENIDLGNIYIKP